MSVVRSAVRITGIGEAGGSVPDPEASLETTIFAAASAALADAGIGRDEVDGIVLAASDQTDGRAISSMLTSGPAGAYLNDEINAASSPGHALALAWMQVLSGTHRRVLISSWGKASESTYGVQAAERLSAEPFYERDGGASALAAAAIQASVHRAATGDPEKATRAAAALAARNNRAVTADAVAASDYVASPLRRLEVPAEIDGAFSLVLERADLGSPGVGIGGIGWRSDIGRLGDRSLGRLEHLEHAVADAYGRAGIDDPGGQVDTWYLHDYTPDAEVLAYAPFGVCAAAEALDLALEGSPKVNPDGGSLGGEAPFGGPLRKVLEGVRAIRGGGAGRCVAHLTTGFAGQFQTAVVLEAGA
jgi:acetyl-CoA C-acetyltransferase